MAPTNRAAFYPSDKAPALVVDSAPYPTAAADELIVRVSATAINAVDFKIQAAGAAVFPFVKYPLVGGFDAAGTVVEVGAGVAAHKPGDRVLVFPGDFASREGGFQNYVVAREEFTSKIPASASFVDAAVLPTGIATATTALFQYVGLEPPTVGTKKNSRDKTVLVSAGAGVVGSNAIQLAVAAGYEVITTSSPKNFSYCTSLGAAKVFDYNSPTLAADLKSALKGKELGGAISCVVESNAVVWEVAAASEGSKKVACTILFSQDGVPEGITTEMVHAYLIKGDPLAKAIFEYFLPQALESGEYKFEPRARVVGKGLESIQAALDVCKTGYMSREKLVVTLEDEA